MADEQSLKVGIAPMEQFKARTMAGALPRSAAARPTCWMCHDNEVRDKRRNFLDTGHGQTEGQQQV